MGRAPWEQEMFVKCFFSLMSRRHQPCHFHKHATSAQDLRAAVVFSAFQDLGLGRSALGTCDEARPITNTLCLMHRDVYLGLMSEI